MKKVIIAVLISCMALSAVFAAKPVLGFDLNTAVTADMSSAIVPADSVSSYVYFVLNPYFKTSKFTFAGRIMWNPEVLGNSEPVGFRSKISSYELPDSYELPEGLDAIISVLEAARFIDTVNYKGSDDKFEIGLSRDRGHFAVDHLFTDTTPRFVEYNVLDYINPLSGSAYDTLGAFVDFDGDIINVNAYINDLTFGLEGVKSYYLDVGAEIPYTEFGAHIDITPIESFPVTASISAVGSFALVEGYVAPQVGLVIPSLFGNKAFTFSASFATPVHYAAIDGSSDTDGYGAFFESYVAEEAIELNTETVDARFGIFEEKNSSDYKAGELWGTSYLPGGSDDSLFVGLSADVKFHNGITNLYASAVVPFDVRNGWAIAETSNKYIAEGVDCYFGRNYLPEYSADKFALGASFGTDFRFYIEANTLGLIGAVREHSEILNTLHADAGFEVKANNFQANVKALLNGYSIVKDCPDFSMQASFKYTVEAKH